MSYPGSPEATGPAPPPPPPPPVPGQVPALRISTATELQGPRRSPLSAGSQDLYEPPAAIQNAMMTKDKKPFTYTPGMGGKLDLSQIRSPRMMRRVAKNANDEGIEGPPRELASPVVTPQQQPNLYSHPQVAIPVFPQGQQPAVNLRNSTLPRSSDRQDQPRPMVKIETKIVSSNNTTPEVQQTPTPPISPTQVTLAKAPTPWMQKNVKQQDDLPEWAKRTNSNRSQDSSSGSDSPQQQQSTALPRQIVVVNTPRQQAPQVQPHTQQSQASMRSVRQESQNERVIPLRVEDRPSVFSAINEPGHHQLQNTNPHHMSRWGNPIGQSGVPQQIQGGACIVPVQVEDQSSSNGNNNQQQQFRSVQNQANRNVQRGYIPQVNEQLEPGPVQSKSFRVLQKITDTDADQVDGEQLRKLQLTEDDRFLMNKFKEQVDGDTYLHKEEDPRYRGAAIPSRAFRYLQNMTDSGDVNSTNNTSTRPANSAAKKQNRNSNTFDMPPAQQYVPASEQQVPEPKKYMGAAIPSRSFRILQAMTAPESIASHVTQDSPTDSIKLPSNQQAVYCPASPAPIPCPAFWNPDIGCWTYYPTQPYSYYDPNSQQHFYYDPQYYTSDSNYPMTMVNCSFDYEAPDSVPNDSKGDECISSISSSPRSRNSDVNSGTCCTYDISTTSELSDGQERRVVLAVSPVATSAPSSEDGKKIQENNSFTREKHKDSEDSASDSDDSDSYLAYSTGLNPLKKQENIDSKKYIALKDCESYESKSDSTDCDRVSVFEGDLEDVEKVYNCEIEVGKVSRTDDEGEIDNTTISVSLPLRTKKFSVPDDDTRTVIVGDSNVTAAAEVENFVDFTLTRSRNRAESAEKKMISENLAIQPTVIVTGSEDESTETEVQVPISIPGTSLDGEGKEYLTVRRKDEVSDDEDSGVTSDTSRMISEVDTDSECCVPSAPVEICPIVRRAGNAKYQRTQTHSRLFKLLNNEQLRVPTIGKRRSSNYEDSLRTSSIASPDSLVDEISYKERRTRPKSLDCEALLKRQNSDPYYRTWKDGVKERKAVQWINPRANVYCPRVRSTKNVPRTMDYESCSKPNTTISSSIPNPVRMNRRCC